MRLLAHLKLYHPELLAFFFHRALSYFLFLSCFISPNTTHIHGELFVVVHFKHGLFCEGSRFLYHETRVPTRNHCTWKHRLELSLHLVNFLSNPLRYIVLEIPTIFSTLYSTDRMRF